MRGSKPEMGALVMTPASMVPSRMPSIRSRSNPSVPLGKISTFSRPALFLASASANRTALTW